MKKGIVGKKIGMTQIFTEDGRLIPVTVIQAGPCPVVQKKTVETTAMKRFRSVSTLTPRTAPRSW